MRDYTDERPHWRTQPDGKPANIFAASIDALRKAGKWETTD